MPGNSSSKNNNNNNNSNNKNNNSDTQPQDQAVPATATKIMADEAAVTKLDSTVAQPIELNQGDYNGCMPTRFVWVVAIAMASFGSTFVFGYCISVLNSPKQKIECFFLETWMSDFQMKEGTNITKEQFMKTCVSQPSLSDKLSSSDDTKLRWMYTMTQVVWVLALAIGGMCTGFFVDRFGRRNSLIGANAFSIMASCLILPTLLLESPLLLYVVRFLAGFHNGLTIPMQSMYATEIAPLRWRGAAGSCGQLFITIGIAIGGLVGLEELLNRESLWAVAVALSGVPSLISSATLPFLPESPRFLYINRNDKLAAEAVVRRSCDPDDAEKTMEDLAMEAHSIGKADSEVFSVLELLAKKKYRLAIALGLVMVSVQQLCGINVVMQYSSIMLENAGADKGSVPYINLMLYVVNVLATIASMFVMERFGRRSLFLVSLLTVLGSLLFIFCFSFFTPSNPLKATSNERLASGVVCGLTFVFVIGFAIGLGSITIMYISEIFQQRERGAANSLCVAAMQICNLFVIVSYYNVLAIMKYYVYLLYVVPVTLGAIFCYFYMPETKNRSVTEIANALANKL